MVEVKQALVGTRLLTLTGTGGSGKTRLALEAARDVIELYPDGVWLIELAPLSDEELVPKAVAQALEVPERPAQPLPETLAEILRGWELLLILDNCGHLLEATARLVDLLLDSCPHLPDHGHQSRSSGSRRRGEVACGPALGARARAYVLIGRARGLRGDATVRPASKGARSCLLLKSAKRPRGCRDLQKTGRHTACHRARCG
jgi:predicted ATPase